MLIPNEKGLFTCKKDDFETDDLFEYMEHFGVEYEWMVRVAPKYTFNMFKFLEALTDMVAREDFNEAWEHIQSATLLLINASGEDFEEFVEEAEVIAGMDTMMNQVEEMLKNESDN